MKKIFILLFLIPLFANAQFENRTHFLAGGNIKLSVDSFQLYDNYVVGAETILGFRLGKLFAGIGSGIEYTGTDYHQLLDSAGSVIKGADLYNIDIPIFIDVTYGRRFYIEGKLGYTVKISNVKELFETQTNTLFNSLGFGYSIPLGKAYLDIALEGKFNYMFTESIDFDLKKVKSTSIYFMPIAKIGFRFAKKI